MTNLRTLLVSEAHQRTGIPSTTLLKLVKSGQLAGNRTGNRWRISEASLAAFVNGSQAAPVVERTSSRAFPEVEDRFA